MQAVLCSNTIPHRWGDPVQRLLEAGWKGLPASAFFTIPRFDRVTRMMMSSPHLAPHDSGVLQRIARGEESAVSEAMDRFGALVWSLAKRMCGSRSEAEDAAQEIFVSIWKSAHRFDPGVASESTFVAMIARRRLIDRIRVSERRPAMAELPETAPDRSNSDQLETSDESRAALDAFKKLSIDQQRVLRLAINSGSSHEQIARALDLPLGSVKTHARRGMIRLRELMSSQDASESGAMA